VSPPTLTARSRALWARLADAPATFGPVLHVAVSPDSQLCPPRWVGIVVLADAVIATAPTPGIALNVQQALETLPAASLTDPTVLSTRLPVLASGARRPGLRTSATNQPALGSEGPHHGRTTAGDRDRRSRAEIKVIATNEVLAALRERWSSQWEVWHICWRSVLAHPTRKLGTRRLCRGHGPGHAEPQTLNPRIRRQARRLSKLSDSVRPFDLNRDHGQGV
jgi:hypothetical protein